MPFKVAIEIKVLKIVLAWIVTRRNDSVNTMNADRDNINIDKHSPETEKLFKMSEIGDNIRISVILEIHIG